MWWHGSMGPRGVAMWGKVTSGRTGTERCGSIDNDAGGYVEPARTIAAGKSVEAADPSTVTTGPDSITIDPDPAMAGPNPTTGASSLMR
ncbi:hypothetical protein SORBI_3006G017266 [Sorghum bicolor]|uniref:Uncharacterized protein n=1 Tax=Sorghum bicolor TaxID=4558 RepID=A0A1Z5RBS0_SORBI|nr:hypothetical protein SORBI_3006G017266 [Sorghum bicolor]